MSYPTKANLRMPNEDAVAPDVRVVVDYVLSQLRERYFGGSNKLASFNLGETLKDMGFTTSQHPSISGLLQESGLLMRISAREGANFVWYVNPDIDVMEMPIEFFEAAWRELRTEDELRTDLRKLKRQLEGLTTTGKVADEEFLAEIDARVQQLVTERDEALSGNTQLTAQVTELTAQVQKLTADLERLPQIDTAVIKSAFLERLDDMVATSHRKRRPPRTDTPRS